jgi:hypothetical protein
MSKAPLTCLKCGSLGLSFGLDQVPPHLRSMVRGEVVQVIRPLLICGTCYRVLCSQCAGGGMPRCPYCQEFALMLPECPSTPPPWWQLRRRWRWRRARANWPYPFGF